MLPARVMPPNPDRPPPGGANLPANDQQGRLQRLGDAMDAFLAFRERGQPATAENFLAEHAHLRDLLEPMLADEQADAKNGDGDALPERFLDHAPNAGQCLGDYRIVREVGRGGMGTVFEAEQISLHRVVALKLLHDHMTCSPEQEQALAGLAAERVDRANIGVVVAGPVQVDVADQRGVA